MIQFTNIDTDLFYATRLQSGSGYTWTLASRLGEMIRVAEHRFGPRDATYTILGVEFGPDGNPRLWYPGDCRHIVIQLTTNCATDVVNACYQLSHECIHLLAPTGNGNANNLEEGLATQFSHEYINNNFRADYPDHIPSYAAARSAVAQLLAIDENAILKLRERNPSFLTMNAANIVETVPDISLELAQFLCAPFVRGSQDA